MSAKQNLNETDNELLSAYLDNALTDAERAALEARLEREPALRRELNALRQTVALVRGLPVFRAPRNFTLTPDMVSADSAAARVRAGKRGTGLSRTIIPFPLVSLMSAAASIALILFGFILIIDQSAETPRLRDEARVSLDSNTMPSDEIAQLATKTAVLEQAEDDAVVMEDAEETEEPAPLLSMEMDAEAEAESDMDEGDVAFDAAPMTGAAEEAAQAMSPPPPAAMDDALEAAPLPQGTPTVDAAMLPMPTLEAGMDADLTSTSTMRQTMPFDGEAGAAPVTDGTDEVQLFMESPEEAGDGTEVSADVASLEREVGVLVPNEAETSVSLEDTDEFDAYPAGFVMIAAGLLLAFITLMMRRMRATSGRR